MGLLFSIIGTPFYQAQGWIPLPLPTFAFGKVSTCPMPKGVRRLEVARDLEVVHALYQAHGLTNECAVLRDDDYWTDGPAQVRGTFPTWGAVREGQLAAYATVESDDEEVWIKKRAARTVVADYLRLPDRHRSGLGMTAGGSLSALLAAVMLIPLDEAMNRLWRRCPCSSMAI